MAGDGKAEQYLLLAKNAKGLALVDLINKATAEPGVLSFGELLSLPATQEVRSTSTWAQTAAPPPPARAPDPSAGLLPADLASAPGRPPPQLRAGEHQQMHSLLELFAYGTWDDYTGRRLVRLGAAVGPPPPPPHCLPPADCRCSPCCRSPPPRVRAASAGKYPALSDQQQLKLKVLTIVTMANQRRVSLARPRSGGAG